MRYALLCGSGYGATYIPILTSPDAPIRLAGILSRGSARSIQYARAANVPHHLSLDELAEKQTDIVIVAVSGDAGIQLAKDALSRGFDVLAEHPWEPDDIEELHDLASNAGKAFHINGHWSDQKNTQHFLQACHTAKSQGPAIFVSMITNPRTLYSGLDILRRALGPLDMSTFKQLSTGESSDTPSLPFKVLQGFAGNTLVTIQYQTFTSQVDDGTSALANHHIVIGFKHGHLTLAETVSPAIWVPDMAALCAMGQSGMQQAASTIFPEEDPPTIGSFLNQHRGDANRLALDRLIKHAETGICPEDQSLPHLLNVSQTWRHCLDLAGAISYIPS